MGWFRSSMVLVVALGLPLRAHAGKLSQAREEVRSSSPAGSDSDGGDGGGGGDDDGDGDGLGAAVGAAILDGAQEVAARLGPPRYAAYPYRDHHHGWIHRNGPNPPRDAPGKSWALRAALEGAYLGDDVWRSALDVELSWWRFAIRNDIGFYLERPNVDALYFGSANLSIAAVMQPKVVWRLGGGVGYMIDGRTLDHQPRENAVGVNGTTTLDVLLVRPLVISGRADVGKLGAATTFTARATLGLAIRRFEAYGGYELRGVGSVRFAGPVFGVRLWF